MNYFYRVYYYFNFNKGVVLIVYMVAVGRKTWDHPVGAP